MSYSTSSLGRNELIAASRKRRDPYEILGVPRDASEQQINTAYRNEALKFHPDKNVDVPKAVEMFRDVAYAYSILSDPEKRQQYDVAGFEAVDL
eukprot:c25551_g1_i1 orf=1-279(-)